MNGYIWVVDYGLGNLRSVSKALERVGARVEVSPDPARLAGAAAVVLPGVGAFDAAVANLRRGGLLAPLAGYLESNRPFLGICLGFQLLFAGSAEGREPGFGIIKDRVERFPARVKVPQIGWNRVAFRADSPLFRDLGREAYFYFVHSYYGVTERAVGTSEYGLPFTAALQSGAVFATQFHPEKSGETGLAVLANFVAWVREHPGRKTPEP